MSNRVRSFPWTPLYALLIICHRQRQKACSWESHLHCYANTACCYIRIWAKLNIVFQCDCFQLQFDPCISSFSHLPQMLLQGFEFAAVLSPPLTNGFKSSSLTRGSLIFSSSFEAQMLANSPCLVIGNLCQDEKCSNQSPPSPPQSAQPVRPAFT